MVKQKGKIRITALIPSEPSLSDVCREIRRQRKTYTKSSGKETNSKKIRVEFRRTEVSPEGNLITVQESTEEEIIIEKKKAVNQGLYSKKVPFKKWYAKEDKQLTEHVERYGS